MAVESNLQKDLENLTADLGGSASPEGIAAQTEKVFASLFKHKIPVIEYPKGQYDPQSQLYVGADSGEPVLVVAGGATIPGIPPGGVFRPIPPPRKEPTTKTTVYYVQETTQRSTWRTTANGTDHEDAWDTQIDWIKDSKADED